MTYNTNKAIARFDEIAIVNAYDYKDKSHSGMLSQRMKTKLQSFLDSELQRAYEAGEKAVAGKVMDEILTVQGASATQMVGVDKESPRWYFKNGLDCVKSILRPYLSQPEKEES